MDRDNSPLILTIDFETTGQDAATAFPIEVALASPDDGAYTYERFIALPPGATIPPEASAVHHIIDADLKYAEPWSVVAHDLYLRATLGGEAEPGAVVMVAHNADYERTVLRDEPFFQACNWVCTFKCALIAFPDAPGHSNEVLRYWLGLGVGRQKAQASHSALHDCRVTAGIFNRLYGEFHKRLVEAGKVSPLYEDTLKPEVQWAVIDEMVRVSNEIAQLPWCPIGKERGKKWEDIDHGFLDWCRKQPDMREDVKHAASKEIERRRNRGGFRGK